MREILKKLVLFVSCLGIFLWTFRAEAFECRGPSDLNKDAVTLATPAESKKEFAPHETIEIRGNLKKDLHERLIDFVVSYNYLGEMMGDDPSSGLFAPELEALQKGDFSIKFPLSRSGPYAIAVQARVLNPDGSCEDLSIGRQIRRIGLPHLSVTEAKVGDSTGPNVTVSQKDDGKGEKPHSVEVKLPSGKRADQIDLCVKPHDTKEPDAGEESVTVTVTNTITLKDKSGAVIREAQIQGGCSKSAGTLCKAVPSGGSFCSGGFVANVLLGDGQNQIDLFVRNGVASQTIRVEPFEIDLKGPDLCVKYLDPSGTEIKDVDGKVLLSKEAKEVTVDLTLGRCGQEPEVITGPWSLGSGPFGGLTALWFLPGCQKAPPSCTGSGSPICIKKNNAAEAVSMCPVDVGGTMHFRVLFGNLRFPLNTATITAKDDLGNQTVETHAFGYGNVRSLFSKDEKGVWDFNLSKAIVPQGVAAFLDGYFIKKKVKDILVDQVLNSKKFKEELFPELLDPRQPGDEEIACLKGLEANDDLIGDGKGCTFDHLASKERVVSIKPVGTLSIGEIKLMGPDLLGWGENRIGLQLVIEGLHGPADMYTLQFIDSDGDKVVDTEDEDRDGDHLCDRFIPHIGDCTSKDLKPPYRCDEVVGLYGSRWKGLNDGYCTLDKTILPEHCPDIKVGRDKFYWGCSDQKNDKNGLPKKIDPKGRLVRDPDFAHPKDTYPTVIPVKFAIKKLAINLDVTLKKGEDGRIRFEITNPTGTKKKLKLVQAIPDDKFPIEFDCGRETGKAAIYQGGITGDPGIGIQPYINKKLCEGLEMFNGSEMLDAKARKFQGTNKQLACTFNATLRCSVPRRLEVALRDLENEKATAISVKVKNETLGKDHKLHMDFFAPLGKADILADPRGIGLTAGGLLIPAGVTDAKDPSEPAELDGRAFLRSLPDEFKNEKFGPIYRASGGSVDPMMAAYAMGSEIGLSLSEETINSALHSVSLLLGELAKKEGDEHQSLDLDARGIRKNLGLAIHDVYSKTVSKEDDLCLDKKGKTIDDNSWECFPFPLSIENLFTERLDYVNPQGDYKYSLTPVLLRSGMNPHLAPTVRLVSVSPMEVWDGKGPMLATLIDLEIEIGLGDLPVSVFEEKVDPISLAAGKVLGTGEIKSWCDKDRFPKVSSRCFEKKPLPIVTFTTSGRIFVRLLLDTIDKGIVRAEGGVSSIKEGTKVVLDKKRSHLEFTVRENNTIVPDNELARMLKEKTESILSQYLFDHARSIRLSIPIQVPLTKFCKTYGKEKELADFCGCILGTKKDDCSSANALQDAWDGLKLDDFGIFGATITQPLLGMTEAGVGPSRYLSIGAGVSVETGIGTSSISLIHSPFLEEIMKTE